MNNMVESLRSFSSEVTRYGLSNQVHRFLPIAEFRVAREVGTDGRLGGQARVPGVAGTWKVKEAVIRFVNAEGSHRTSPTA